MTRGAPITDMTRYMRNYMAKRRNSISWKSLAEDAAVLVAVAAGEITEGRAAAVLGIDRFDLRGQVNQMLALAGARCNVEVDDGRFRTFTVDAGMGVAR